VFSKDTSVTVVCYFCVDGFRNEGKHVIDIYMLTFLL